MKLRLCCNFRNFIELAAKTVKNEITVEKFKLLCNLLDFVWCSKIRTKTFRKFLAQPFESVFSDLSRSKDIQCSSVSKIQYKISKKEAPGKQNRIQVFIPVPAKFFVRRKLRKVAVKWRKKLNSTRAALAIFAAFSLALDSVSFFICKQNYEFSRNFVAIPVKRS